MLFYDVLLSIDRDEFTAVLEQKRIDKAEQVRYFTFMELLLEKDIKPSEKELIFNIFEDKEEVLVLENGFGFALDFIDWDDCLGFQVKTDITEKQTTLEHFVYLVLHDLTFEGFDEREREMRVDSLKQIDGNIDKDESWYRMLLTIQGKEGLLVEDEIYTPKEFSEMGLRTCQLIKEEKTVRDE